MYKHIAAHQVDLSFSNHAHMHHAATLHASIRMPTHMHVYPHVYTHAAHQVDFSFNHAYVRYELQQYTTTVRILEQLCSLDKHPAPTRLKQLRKKKNKDKPHATKPPHMEPKWVDLLIKSYVKVGRVAEAVVLTDVQLETPDKSIDGIVRARVALNVYPWRHGAASWDRLNVHYKELVKASELSLTMNASEVEKTSMRMTPHNSLIFLSR
jgi:hypothetical protein